MLWLARPVSRGTWVLRATRRRARRRLHGGHAAARRHRRDARRCARASRSVRRCRPPPRPRSEPSSSPALAMSASLRPRPQRGDRWSCDRALLRGRSRTAPGSPPSCVAPGGASSVVVVGAVDRYGPPLFARDRRRRRAVEPARRCGRRLRALDDAASALGRRLASRCWSAVFRSARDRELEPEPSHRDSSGAASSCAALRGVPSRARVARELLRLARATCRAHPHTRRRMPRSERDAVWTASTCVGDRTRSLRGDTQQLVEALNADRRRRRRAACCALWLASALVALGARRERADPRRSRRGAELLGRACSPSRTSTCTVDRRLVARSRRLPGAAPARRLPPLGSALGTARRLRGLCCSRTRCRRSDPILAGASLFGGGRRRSARARRRGWANRCSTRRTSARPLFAYAIAGVGTDPIDSAAFAPVSQSSVAKTVNLGSGTFAALPMIDQRFVLVPEPLRDGVASRWDWSDSPGGGHAARSRAERRERRSRRPRHRDRRFAPREGATLEPSRPFAQSGGRPRGRAGVIGMRGAGCARGSETLAVAPAYTWRPSMHGPRTPPRWRAPQRSSTAIPRASRRSCRDGVVDLLGGDFAPTFTQRSSTRGSPRGSTTSLPRSAGTPDRHARLPFRGGRGRRATRARAGRRRARRRLRAGQLHGGVRAPRRPEGLVVGLDIAALDARASRAAACAASDSTTCVLVRGDALALPFRDAVFSKLNCSGGLHQMPDLDRALAEMARVARAARALHR